MIMVWMTENLQKRSKIIVKKVCKQVNTHSHHCQNGDLPCQKVNKINFNKSKPMILNAWPRGLAGLCPSTKLLMIFHVHLPPPQTFPTFLCSSGRTKGAKKTSKKNSGSVAKIRAAPNRPECSKSCSESFEFIKRIIHHSWILEVNIYIYIYRFGWTDTIFNENKNACFGRWLLKKTKKKKTATARFFQVTLLGVLSNVFRS